MRDLVFDLNNCLTRKLTICVKYGKWCQRFPLASARLSKLWILCV